MRNAPATLDDYLARYGAILGKQSHDNLVPLHSPGVDPIDAGCDELLRKPMPAQAHVISASVKALRRQKSMLVIGQTGTGKTIMTQGIVNCHAAGKPYKALVMCPGQLCKKWERELRETIPGVRVTHITDWRDLVPFLRRPENADPWWFIVSRDRAKLGYKRRDGFTRKLAKFENAEGQAVMDLAAHCPDCGQITLDKDGHYKEPDCKSPEFCQAVRLGPDGAPKKRADGTPILCGAALWQASRDIWRAEPAKMIHRKLHKWFDYFILDEAHEEKGANTAQANAAGSLAAAAKKVLALTGTLIGGYAEHIRPLLFRLAPNSLVNEGFGWTEVMPFNQRYGRIDTIVREKEGPTYSNSQSRGRKSVTKVVRPGIMPTLFGRHLIGNTVFLSLDEVSEALPELREEVVPCSMDQDLATHYRVCEEELLAEIKLQAARGSKKLLGPMLNCLLTYPDYPFDWDPVGYTDFQSKAFVAVTEPPTLPDQVRAKESALLEAIENERSLGRQCWVYVLNNGKHDVQGRLEQLLCKEGFRVDVLNASVPMIDREEWITKRGKKVDVVLSHPKLVETGLDLFSKKGMGHNFCSLMFYQTGYNLFTLRQAAARAWRIGQKKLCKVFYFYYQGTMQERAMALMGKKLVAAQALEGKFSSEGLVAMGGDDNIEMALAKSLVERMDTNAARTWQKIGSDNVIAGNVTEERMRRIAEQADMPLFDDEAALLAAFRSAKGGAS